MHMAGTLRIRKGLLESYPDVLTAPALDALAALAPLDEARRELMRARIDRRATRFRDRERIGFLPPDAIIGRSRVPVSDARAGRFDGSEIPADLQRQWIQGTGPAARPRTPVAESIRNVAYALLSGADGWMFDGEDALGQIETMSLDNQRNLKLAFARADLFMTAAERVAGEMNAWARDFLGRPIVADWTAAARFHDPDLPGPRASSRRPSRPGARRRRLLGVDRGHGALRGEQPRRVARGGPQPRPLSSKDPDRRGSGVVERHDRRARAARSACRAGPSRCTSWSSRSKPASS